MGVRKITRTKGVVFADDHRFLIREIWLQDGYWQLSAEAPGPLPALKPGSIVGIRIHDPEGNVVAVGRMDAGWDEAPVGATAWLTLRMRVGSSLPGEEWTTPMVEPP
jgi:hypothetical protein